LGSVFGTIGYPGHAVYSATKFALRGFSEALRRELDGTNLRVHYLAPRSTRTKFNSSAVEALNEQFGIAMDSPERVAASLLDMLERNRAEAVIGWPEKLFARLNAMLPRLVDRALAKQLPAIRRYSADCDSQSPQISPLSRRAS
jgi:short-subunit dehydrogenase